MEFGAAHSSSQRPSDTIGNTPPPSCQSSLVTPAGPPPPAGVIICAECMALLRQRRKASGPFSNRLKVCAAPPMPGVKCMRLVHGCHSYPALLRDALPGYIHIISRATISSSQRPRQDWQPLLLPGCQSISAKPAGPPPPAGYVFAPHPNRDAWPPLPLWRIAQFLARILPTFPLDMHKTHGCRAVTALFFSAMQRIFQIIRSGRRQGRAAAQ